MKFTARGQKGILNIITCAEYYPAVKDAMQYPEEAEEVVEEGGGGERRLLKKKTKKKKKKKKNR